MPDPFIPSWDNFTAGEFSPRLEGQVRLAKYYNSAKTLENFMIHPHGGAFRRPGTYYIAPAKNADKKCRLFPFVFSEAQAYVLEFGDQYIRFFYQQGQVASGSTPYEISTPYVVSGATNQVAEIKIAQSGDIAYIAHPLHQPRKLSRLGHSSWALATFAYTNGTLGPSSTASAWGGATWPGSVGWFEQRLWFAGTNQFPQTLWASKSGDYEDFSLGTDDDAGLEYTIAADQINQIRWLVAHSRMVIGTVGAEWAVGARSALDPITPTNVAFQRETTYGSANIQGRLINSAVVLVSRSGRKIREFSYSYEADGYVGRDLTLLAEHITDPGIVEIEWAQDPDSVVLALRSDGVIITGTYYPPEQVMAWARQVTNGSFESIAVIPGEKQDDIYVVVSRTVGGSVKRFIEVFRENDFGGDVEDAFFLDSGLTYSGATTDSISGMGHLAGATVSILADGSVHADKAVSSGGTVTLDRSAQKVQLGLGYDSTLETPRVEYSVAGGTSQSTKKRISEVAVRLYETVGGKVGVTNSDDSLFILPFRTTADRMDQAVPLYSGDKVAKVGGGWDQNGRVVVKQDQPLPMTVLAVFPRLTPGGA